MENNKGTNFAKCCRQYYHQKEMLSKTEVSINKPIPRDIPEIRITVMAQRRLDVIKKQLLYDNIQMVDKEFEKIEKKCSKEARDVMWDVYVEQLGQKTVAPKYCMALPTLKKNVAKWKEKANLN